MQKAQNKLAVLSCSHSASEFLFPLPGKEMDAQYEAFSLVGKTVKEQLGSKLLEAPHLTEPCESLLAGSISMALCYISRLQKNVPAGVKMHSRICVITGSNEGGSQYITFMNAFFTARKLGIVVDTCALDKTLTLLQQGCDITKGQYLKVEKLDGLLQFLLWVFLPPPQMRHKLVLPPAPKLDYRASCFCHRQLVDIGYVCSVCLSVFCKYTPICTTCNAIFKAPEPLTTKPKKKKKTDKN
ncbi:hypothetical protein AWZ03_015235 [Drosophila navojoa]|uniref:General transcription factor IIH subunit 3 n=2 Tax=Drosophila navojoa TaxID=7232 RepID=A0A484AN04_DRONA|nr:hypothetical protein AWZ03_015235 [Drosophila navojoa]